MSSEPLRNTLPQTPSRVNPKPVDISAARARCEARMRVVYDTALSPGARLCYVALDDYGRMDGSAWPWQETLAEKFGVSTRQVKRWVAELEAAGHIAITRTQRGNRYELTWIVTSQVTNLSPTRARSVYESRPEAPACPHCGCTRLSRYGLCAACCRPPALRATAG